MCPEPVDCTEPPSRWPAGQDGSHLLLIATSTGCVRSTVLCSRWSPANSSSRLRVESTGLCSKSQQPTDGSASGSNRGLADWTSELTVECRRWLAEVARRGAGSHRG